MLSGGFIPDLQQQGRVKDLLNARGSVTNVRPPKAVSALGVPGGMLPGKIKKNSMDFFEKIVKRSK